MRDDSQPAETRPSGGKLAAWAVHALTASGVVIALLATDATFDGRAGDAFLWLFAALLIDGIDGTLARAARVKERLPRIDGDVLDLLIDYITYVFIPALLIWRMDVLPAGLGLPLAGLIVLSSLYVFARCDMKTDDGYFRGFPALWNIIAFYFFVAPPQPEIAVLAIVGFVVLTFAPVHVVHPFRVRDYGVSLPLLACVWALATVALLLPGLGAWRDVLLAVSLTSAAVLIALGLWRSLRGPRALSNRSGAKGEVA